MLALDLVRTSIGPPVTQQQLHYSSPRRPFHPPVPHCPRQCGFRGCVAGWGAGGGSLLFVTGLPCRSLPPQPHSHLVREKGLRDGYLKTCASVSSSTANVYGVLRKEVEERGIRWKERHRLIFEEDSQRKQRPALCFSDHLGDDQDLQVKDTVVVCHTAYDCGLPCPNEV